MTIAKPGKEAQLHQLSVTVRLVVVGASLLVVAGCLKTVENTSGCVFKSIAYVIGDTARDSLAAGVCNFHSFHTASQANLRIALSSPANQAILQIYDQGGAIIANSYISGGADTSARLRVMLDTGAYGLLVRGVTPGKTGAYRISATVDTTPVGGCGYVWVTPGISTPQKLVSTDCTTGPDGPNYYYHVYTIVLRGLQSLTFTEHSTAFSPQMTLVAATGSTVSAIDSTGTNASISYVAASQGAYQLWVGSSNQFQLGAYTLKLQ